MKAEELMVKEQPVDSYDLEQKSIIAYRSIAAEYYDKRHMTCRAFDFLNEKIVHVYQNRHTLLKDGNIYLEVGAGRAILLRHILPPSSNIIIGDVCDEMAKFAFPLPQNMTYRNFSAFNLPFSESYFDGVFAFLADSYNIKRFYQEALRVIKPGSFLFVTHPSILWARTLRQGEGETLNYARFSTLNGGVFQIPSITRSTEGYNELLRNTGFKQVFCEEFCIPPNYPLDCIPDTINIPARQVRIEVSRLPLVTAVMGLK